MNHIIVVSENVLPLNITPYRGIYPTKDGVTLTINQIILKLPDIILQSLKEDTYSKDQVEKLRLPEDSYKDFELYQHDIEKMMMESLEARKNKQTKKTSIMISYRNSHSEEVEEFKSIIENLDNKYTSERNRIGIEGDYEVKVLHPASLCGAYEAHTPMRRWMLVGLLDDHIRSVEEVWIYLTDDYTNSWWTMAEIVMTANINKDAVNKKVVKVYDVKNKKLITDITEMPSWVYPEISKEPVMEGE